MGRSQTSVAHIERRMQNQRMSSWEESTNGRVLTNLFLSLWFSTVGETRMVESRGIIGGHLGLPTGKACAQPAENFWEKN